MNNLRSNLPALENKFYFNYGGQGPLPKASLDSITASWVKIQQLGPFTNDVWPFISNEIQETKLLIARLCGVSTKRIALTENVTTGCILPLLGIPFLEGERILISNCEHPGVVSACKELAKQKKLCIDIFDVQSLSGGIEKAENTTAEVIKSLELSLTPKTRLVVLSHLLWNTGEIMPIELIASFLGKYKDPPFLLVDAAQSFGQIPIGSAASKADIYAFTGHKWAFGPEGLGATIVSERILEQSNPTLVGWKSLKNEGSIYSDNTNPYHSDGRKFEIATSCTPLLSGLRCSLELLEKEGTDYQRIEKIQSLSKELWVELRKIHPIKLVLQSPPQTGLLSFSVKSNMSHNQIVRALGKKSTWIRVLEDPTWLRACVHITTTREEIKELTKRLKEISKE
ncbi:MULTISPECIES: aminotransferase class V-fold PLP-dependent enzyme [unclassified Prochlorococcus]|uniref:aminotransferase class V-fold PLP-dependent enzyme n=1 Tax=unclassified Prochlorococcus TaxID=2627481 RepID=UPI0005336ED5|nr:MULTISPECIES: aminotransferase class V-fold PLP-dependent enzyme [unclassified Prochlorococcus]KGG16546.1 Cysteine desulfurase [Prochlorococcus sp. MIT 0602]KGG16979.1 Cysteine desulfurase [Prochlorococcus sp. MIT 0603]